MKRNYLLELLQRYETSDLNIKSRIITFIKQYENCFERSLDIGHITASSWLLNYNKTMALLTHHKKLGDWLQLGGHCDGDPNVLNVAIREATEESGLDGIIALSPEIFDIDIHLTPANSNDGEHSHYDIRFLLQATLDQNIKVSHESHDLRWVDKNIINLPTENKSVVRMYQKWLNL